MLSLPTFLRITIFLSLIININSINVKIGAKNIESYCEKNLYKIIIGITDLNNNLKDYTSFYLTTYTEANYLLFKCMIEPKKMQIICIANLQHHKLALKADDTITLPYPFPEVGGITWDYNSFLILIYRRTIRIKEECGESVLKSNISNLDTSKWDLIAKVNRIYGGECLLSDTIDNIYSFKMNLNIIGGNLKQKFDQQIVKKDNYNINFLQNITMPFLIGPLKSLIKSNYIYHEYYKMAFCYPIDEINSTNYLNDEGIDFYCNIPISDQYIFNGPLKIKTFSDNIFAHTSSKIENDNIDIISLYFTIEKAPILNENNDFNVKDGEEEEDDDEDYEEEKESIDKEEEDDENYEEEKERNDKEEGKNKKINETEEQNKRNDKNYKKENNDDGNQEKEKLKYIRNSSSKQSSLLKHSFSSSSSNLKKSSYHSVKPSSSSSSSSIKSSSSTLKNVSPSIKSSGRILSTLNLRGLEKTSNKKKKNYLLLDNRVTNFICPDKPIFEIVDSQKGIIYEPILQKEDKYNIILTGYLKNGYKILDDTIIPLEYTTKEINFNLSITNNLVEEISEKKKYIPCTLNSGTFFLEKETTKIKCIGDKNDQNNLENTDLTINWASKENKYLNNILIKWPKILNVHSKKVYSYKIKALSIKKTDHVCFDDKYIFYINIFDLKSEPQITFQFDMKMPSGTKSNCKLYTSNMLKCYIDLRLKRIKKESKIKLPQPGNYNITTTEGNYINFTILEFSNENETAFEDEGIFSEQACGNNMFIGAIQDIGYEYSSAIAIIVSILVIFFVAFLGIGYCIIYEINIRNKKGDYFAHTEEKKVNTNNTSVTANPIAAIQK